MKKTYIRPNINVRAISEDCAIMAASVNGEAKGSLDIYDTGTKTIGSSEDVGAKKSLLWDNFGDDEE